MAYPVRTRRGATAQQSRKPEIFAALDLGTNNCRLLIAQREGDSFRVIDSFSQIVRLGEGLSVSGVLSAAAMERAHAALARCAERLKRHSVTRFRFVATQACRMAANGQNFLSEVESKHGIRLRAIPAKEEAKFALLGALDLIDPSFDFALVLDIGGGSTELCWVDAKAVKLRGVKECARRPPILGWASFPVGVVSLAEDSDYSSDSWYQFALGRLVDTLRNHDGAKRFGPLFEAGRGHLVGNSGTVTSIAGVHLGLQKYARAAVDGAWLTRSEVNATRTRLCNWSHEERAAEPCIGPGRADLILAGCAILDAVWTVWPSARLRVGDRGLREGMLVSMLHGAAG